MIRTGVAKLVATVVVSLALAGTAAAETPLDGGWSLDGSAAAGLRLFLDPSDEEKGKLEEYRDFNSGPFLDSLRLRLHTDDEKYSFEFGGRQWGLQDQPFRLGAERLGLFRLEFEWDQIPHVLSTTGRLLATQPRDDVLVLPLPRPPLSVHNSAPRRDEIGFRTDNARATFTLTLTPGLDLTAEYTRTWKHGDRPFGIAFGSPGNNVYEVLEPISTVTHDVRLRATWAQESYQLQFDYVFSLFDNGFNSVTADNPCFANTAACEAGDGGAAAPASGRSALPPSNMAHTFSLSCGVNLPWWRTRVNGHVTYSLRLQNEDFLPHTINPAIVSPGLVLPQKSLDGHVDTFLVHVGVVTRPLPPLSVTGKYRLYRLDDRGDEPAFLNFVQDDRTLLEGRRATRFGYDKHNADVDARWRFNQVAALTVGSGWERWDRTAGREVPISDEYSGKLALDVTPLDWLSGRLTYKPSFRRIDAYNTGAHAAHSVLEEPATVSVAQSPLLRKFDEADRDRHRIDLVVNATPFGRAVPLLETLTISPSFSWHWDDYIDSPLGLQQAEGWAAGIDLSWAPTERVAFYTGYMHERLEQRQRSRSRPVVGTTTFDFPDFDWVSRHVDDVDTVWAGVQAALIPKRLDWTLTASYAFARGTIETSNPVTPTSGTAAQNTTATAQPFPDFETELLQVTTGLRYSFRRSWTAALSYMFETFRNKDWRTDSLTPFVPGVTSIWLGNRTEDYAAHIVSATLGYRF